MVTYTPRSVIGIRSSAESRVTHEFVMLLLFLIAEDLESDA
jgi:hypothetical protein